MFLCVFLSSSPRHISLLIEVHLYPLSRASDEWFGSEPTFVPGDGQTHALTLFSKHVLNDVALSWIRSQTCVAQLDFGGREPRRVELSADAHLLLVHGAQFRDTPSLVVYRIHSASPVLQPIFHENALALLDAAFAPDSRSLAVLPAAAPGRIWLVPLVARDTAIHSDHLPVPDIAACATATLAVVGPALDCFGFVHEPRRIASYGGVSSYMRPRPPAAADDVVDALPYHFATWGDESDGSFCLWSVWTDAAASGVPLFRTYPQLLVPTVRNLAWLDEPTTPKHSIRTIKFSRTTAELLVIVRRDNYRRAQDNGIAMQTIRLDGPDGIVIGSSRILTTPTNKPVDALLQVTWSLPMLLGTQPCAVVVAEDGGLCEISQQVYSALFLEKHEFFYSSVRCIAQVDRYRRLWLDKHGRLRMLFIEPRQAVPQAHSWGAMFDFTSNDSLPLRLLAAKIGYTIKDHRNEDANVSLRAKLEAMYVRAVKKAVLATEPIAASAVQQGEAFQFVRDAAH